MIRAFALCYAFGLYFLKPTLKNWRALRRVCMAQLPEKEQNPRPIAEIVCEKWRAILGTKPRKRDGRVRSGLKAKAIHYGGKVYTSWKEACAATGKTSDAIRWAIKQGTK